MDASINLTAINDISMDYLFQFSNIDSILFSLESLILFPRFSIQMDELNQWVSADPSKHTIQPINFAQVCAVFV